MRYTAGELFLPMSVDTYVREAALWAIDPATDRSLTLLADHGQLNLERLCAQANAVPGAKLQLRYVPGSLDRRRLRRWRRRPGPAKVLLDDAPGGGRSASAGSSTRSSGSHCCCGAGFPEAIPPRRIRSIVSTATDTYPYYAHVSTDGGYVVVQYWFFYAMNDWRSSFAGVNDHEADWEQMTIYLRPVRGATAVAEGCRSAPAGLGGLLIPR